MWGMSYIPLQEAETMKPPCESLGHFYEDFQCIYCPANYCATEKDGHSFEAELTQWPLTGSFGASPRFCYHCKRKVVNLRKG